MAVRILHAADLHMDSPFQTLPEDKALMMRREQRETLMRIAGIANDNGCQIVLLSGDLFDSGASCADTGQALIEALAGIKGRVFISPGNHDYYTKKSPYCYLKFPENVHVFTSKNITSVEIPELNCRVWGAAMTAPETPDILEGFSLPESDTIEIMTLHGDTSGGVYGPVSYGDIEKSGLDYLALGHVHTYSGILNAGKTAYAYPGCPQGRGFDETGEKGVIVGAVGKDGCDLDFVPVSRRQYRLLYTDMTAGTAERAVREALSRGDFSRDICRVVIKGENGGKLDTSALERTFENQCFHLTVRDETTLPLSLWDAAGDDSLKGLFVRRARALYDAAAPEDKRKYELAVKYGLAALENREEWRP